MRFGTNKLLNLIPLESGYEVRMSTENRDDGYRLVVLTTKEAWRIVEFIQDCEMLRKWKLPENTTTEGES